MDGAKLDLDCGIAWSRIANWLDSELNLPRDQNHWVFGGSGPTCRIVALPLQPRTLGALSLERTRLRAEGDVDAVASFEQLFTLRFASAGG